LTLFFSTLACLTAIITFALATWVLSFRSTLKVNKRVIKYLCREKKNLLDMQRNLLIEISGQRESLGDLAFAYLNQEEELKKIRKLSTTLLMRYNQVLQDKSNIIIHITKEIMLQRRALGKLSGEWLHREEENSQVMHNLKKENSSLLQQLAGACEHSNAISTSAARLADKVKKATT